MSLPPFSLALTLPARWCVKEHRTEHTTQVDSRFGPGLIAVFACVHRLYPEASIIGTDLSPIQPGWVPPNVQFFVDDAESDWTFDGEFDFVHIRGMLGSTEDWPRLIEQVFT